MYAVIRTGGKQQRVKSGDVIEVERIVNEGETVSFQPLLVVDDDGATHVGTRAAGATVTAKPLGEKKGEKIRVLRYRPKTGYAKRTGHRQLLTLLEIEAIELGTGTKRTAAKPARREPAASEQARAGEGAQEAPSEDGPDEERPDGDAEQTGGPD
jgi:large subunit ribosomal protein L21